MVYRYVFLAIYTAEMVIKTISKGFILNKYTYLRNPWNWLDFIVIISGYATIGMDVGNLAGLRTFRVLRALKTVSIMPGNTMNLCTCRNICIHGVIILSLGIWNEKIKILIILDWSPRTYAMNVYNIHGLFLGILYYLLYWTRIIHGMLKIDHQDTIIQQITSYIRDS